MKITPKGPGDADLTQSQALQNDKKIATSSRDRDANTAHAGESAKVSISSRARELQRIAELAQRGDELRAEKVQAIKEQVEAGTYEADAAEVSKSIVRSEVGRLLEKK